MANNEYHVQQLYLDDLSLTGNLDLSELPELTHVSCNTNKLSSINISGCSLLTYLSCSNSGISSLDISSCLALKSLNCEGNYLDVASGTVLMSNINTLLSEDNTLALYKAQKLYADKTLFNQNEYTILSDFASTDGNLSLLGWDLDKPGEWQGTAWELIDGEYKLKELSFEYKKVTSTLDLSGFTHLTMLNCSMTDISSASVPRSLGIVSPNMFYDCQQLEGINIPNDITSIGEDAFFNCIKLKHVKLGNNVTSIDINAFRNCSGLINITLPPSINAIGDTAFYGCSALRSVVFMGNAPALMGQNVFENCINVKVYYHTVKTGFTSPVWKGYPSECMTKNIFSFISDNALIRNSDILSGKLSLDAINFSTPRQVYISIAVYAADDALVSVDTAQTALNTGGNLVSIIMPDTNIPNRESYTVKALIWSDYNSAIPLTDTITIREVL